MPLPSTLKSSKITPELRLRGLQVREQNKEKMTFAIFSCKAFGKTQTSYAYCLILNGILCIIPIQIHLVLLFYNGLNEDFKHCSYSNTPCVAICSPYGFIIPYSK